MRFISTVLAVSLLGLVTAGATADDVTTTSGRKIKGKLVAVDAQGVTFSTGAAQVPIAAREITVIDFGHGVAAPPKGATYSEIELTDGSTFRVAKFALKGKKFETEQLTGPSGKGAPTFEIPMGTVFAAMKRADDAKLRDAWKKLLANRGKYDLYVQQQETGLTYAQGTIHGGSDDGQTVRFEREGGGKPDDLRQLRSAGLVFHQAQPTTIAPTLCRVHDVYGNVLTATAIALSPEGVTVTTVSGATAKYTSTAALAKLDYAQGNVAYLSDLDAQVEAPELPPEEKKLNPTVAVLKDRSLSNDALKLDNVPFGKGLCVAPDTVLTYTLGGDYAQFKATVGIDENGANATSAAKLTVEADGQTLFTDVLRRKDKSKELVLAVKGAKQLRIIVEADTPLNGNYVTLADAKVQK